MQTRPLVRTAAAAVAIAAVALALMGAAWQTPTATPPAIPMVGVPTGEYVNGVEVQRLPAINVTARRTDAR